MYMCVINQLIDQLVKKVLLGTIHELISKKLHFGKRRLVNNIFTNPFDIICTIAVIGSVTSITTFSWLVDWYAVLSVGLSQFPRKAGKLHFHAPISLAWTSVTWFISLSEAGQIILVSPHVKSSFFTPIITLPQPCTPKWEKNDEYAVCVCVFVCVCVCVQQGI